MYDHPSRIQREEMAAFSFAGRVSGAPFTTSIEVRSMRCTAVLAKVWDEKLHPLSYIVCSKMSLWQHALQAVLMRNSMVKYVADRSVSHEYLPDQSISTL